MNPDGTEPAPLTLEELAKLGAFGAEKDPRLAQDVLGRMIVPAVEAAMRREAA